jgi:hypothetical protein
MSGTSPADHDPPDGHVPRARLRQALAHVAWAVALLAAAYALAQYRRDFIKSFFVRGSGDAGPPALAVPEGAAAAGLPRSARVRVVLIDGVDRRTSEAMPSYHALCARGLDLVVDAGFPTVSLPIQSALWGGLTQQQTGIQFIGEALPEPLADSVPARVPGSIAVAEYYPFIARSSGFLVTLPTAEFAGADREQWVTTGYMPAAEAIMASDSPLAFVHILRVDSAGHKHGRVSEEFERAVREADAMLGALIAAEGGRPDTRWLVLADHGHRAGGGHGDAEPEIRLARACLAGDLPPGLDPSATAGGGVHQPIHMPVHMIDLARALADSLGVALPGEGLDASAGRPLAAALAAPAQPGATLPRPGAGRWLLAALLALATLAASALAARAVLWAWPAWWLVAVAAVALLAEPPSLSVPMVYRPWGLEMVQAAWPGLLLLLAGATLALGRMSALRAGVALLALPAGLTTAAHALCWGSPPLMPFWTGRTSMCLTLLASGAAVVALAHLARAVLVASGRARPAEGRPARS